MNKPTSQWVAEQELDVAVTGNSAGLEVSVTYWVAINK